MLPRVVLENEDTSHLREPRDGAVGTQNHVVRAQRAVEAPPACARNSMRTMHMSSRGWMRCKCGVVRELAELGIRPASTLGA